jgi:hypothetical protein
MMQGRVNQRCEAVISVILCQCFKYDTFHSHSQNSKKCARI